MGQQLNVDALRLLQRATTRPAASAAATSLSPGTCPPTEQGKQAAPQKLQPFSRHLQQPGSPQPWLRHCCRVRSCTPCASVLAPCRIFSAGARRCSNPAHDRVGRDTAEYDPFQHSPSEHQPFQFLPPYLISPTGPDIDSSHKSPSVPSRSSYACASPKHVSHAQSMDPCPCTSCSLAGCRSSSRIIRNRIV